MSTARKLMAGAQRAYQFDFIQYLNSITTDGTYKDATGDGRAIKGGMGISFNGTNNYGEVAATNWGTGAKVITTVFKTPASFSNQRFICSLGSSAYRSFIDPDGVLSFGAGTAGETLTTSTVYILQAYYDAGGALTKYVLNGTEYTLSAPAGAVVVNTYYIGARNGASIFFSGEMYYHSVSGFGEWFLEDTDAENTTMTTLYDASGNNNHMTLRGTIASTTRIAVPSQPSVRDLYGFNASIASDGTDDYIDTGIVITDDIDFEFKGRFTTTPASNAHMGAKNGTDRTYIAFKSGDYFGVGFGTTSTATDIAFDTNFHTFEKRGGAYYIDGVSKATGLTTENTLSAALFGLHEPDFFGTYVRISANYFKAWDISSGERVLVQHLVAVYAGQVIDGKTAPSNCMYDFVSGEFFENDGTGSFAMEYIPANLSNAYYDVLGNPLYNKGKCSFDAQIKSTGVYLNGTDNYITAPHTITDFTQGSFFINFLKDSTQSNSAGLLLLTDSNSFRYGAVARETYDTITFLYKGKSVYSDISALTTKTLEYRFTEVGDEFYVHYKVNGGTESSLSITNNTSAVGTANTVYIGYNPISSSLLFKGTFYEIRTPEETWYFKDYLAGATNVTNFVGQNGTLATMNGTVASTTIVSTTGQYPANALQGYDTVLTFDGSNDFIQLNDGSDFNLGNGDFTIEVVADFTYRSIAETDILSKWDFSASKRQYALRLASNGGIYFYTSSTGADTHSLVVDPENVPRRIAKFKIERISGTTKAYFNDVEVDYTGAVADTIYTSDTPLRLGLHNGLYSPIKISKCAITSTDGNIDLTAVQAGTVINGARATYNGLYDSVSDTFLYNDTPSTNALAIRCITADDSGDNPLTGEPAFYQPSAEYWNGGGTIIQNVNMEWVDSYLTTYKWFTAGVAKELSLADLPSAGDEIYWKVGSKYAPLRGDWGVYFCGYLNV